MIMTASPYHLQISCRESKPRHAAPENVLEAATAHETEALAFDARASIETTQEPSRSGGIRLQPVRYEDEVLLLDNDERVTYKEAMMDPYLEKWLIAMKSEIDSMYENQVWNLVDPPEGTWIYKKKTDADGNATVYKARLVTKVFRQIQGFDYDETFSPVAMLKSVRIILAIVAYFDYEIW